MKYITQKELLSKYSKITSTHLYNYRNKGKLEFRKVGSKYEYTVKSVELLLGTKLNSTKIKQNPVEEFSDNNINIIQENEYIIGRDSKLILSGKLNIEKIKLRQQQLLDKANKDMGTNCRNWYEFSELELTEDQINKYSDNISWYTLLKYNRDRVFSDKFIKKHKNEFILKRLNLI